MKKKFDMKFIFFVLFIMLILIFSIRVFITKEVVGSDGIYHYVVARSLLFDKNIHLENEYDYYINQTSYFTQKPKLLPSQKIEGMLPSGYINNVMSLGPDLLWIPFIFIIHIIIILINLFGAQIPANGFSWPYEYIAGITSIAFGIIGLYFIYKLSLNYVKKNNAIISTITIFFATSVLYYAILQPTTSHILSMAFVSFFIYYWFTKKNTPHYYLISGILAGLMALMRWQDVLFISIVAIDGIDEIKNSKKIKKVIIDYVIFAISALVTFFPQMLFWHTLHGKWFTIPQGSHWLNYFNPNIIGVLFSPDNGLFFFTPILILAVIGFITLWKKDNKITVYFLSMLLLQVYLNAIVPDWDGGDGFGARRFINCTIMFAIGLGVLIEELSKRIDKRYVYIMLGVFTIWNGILIIESVLKLITLGTELNIMNAIKNTIKIPSELFNLIKK